jgi:protein O-mannosyl-transferase
VNHQPAQLSKFGPALTAAGLALALYAVTIGGTYIYDDVQIIEHDPRIHLVRSWGQLWTTDYFNGGIDNLYRPLVSQSFALQWWLHGDRPWAFHLVNILLHAGFAAAVAEMTRRLMGAKSAYIAGLLFAAHPIHVEAVAGIVGRCDEMCALFIVLGLVLFLHRPLTGLRAVGIAACAIAAMLSKEQGLLFPFILLALALCTDRRPESANEKQIMLLLTLALCLAVAGLINLREEILKLPFEWDKVFLDETIQPLKDSGPRDRMLMVFVILGHYASLMVAPWKLSIDYGTAVMNSTADLRDPYLYLGFLAALLIVGAFWLSISRRDWAPVFCLVAAALTYGMISNIILIGAIFGERLMYVPSAFLIPWLAFYLAKLPTKSLAVASALLMVLASMRTVTYAARWNDRLGFYESSLADQPKSVRMYALLAFELMARGDLPRAAQVAANGREVDPQYWNMWILSGKIAETQGNLHEAEAMYRKAFELKPISSIQAMLLQVEEREESATRP